MKLVMNVVRRTDMKIVYAAGIATGVAMTKIVNKLVKEKGALQVERL